VSGQLYRVAEGLSYKDITLVHRHPPLSPQKSENCAKHVKKFRRAAPFLQGDILVSYKSVPCFLFFSPPPPPPQSELGNKASERNDSGSVPVAGGNKAFERLQRAAEAADNISNQALLCSGGCET
jgi:hypothetical protein